MFLVRVSIVNLISRLLKYIYLGFDAVRLRLNARCNFHEFHKFTYLFDS